MAIRTAVQFAAIIFGLGVLWSYAVGAASLISFTVAAIIAILSGAYTGYSFREPDDPSLGACLLLAPVFFAGIEGLAANVMSSHGIGEEGGRSIVSHRSRGKRANLDLSGSRKRHQLRRRLHMLRYTIDSRRVEMLAADC